MVHIKRKVIVFIMVFFISAFVFPQEKQADSEMKLREEILVVYQTKGEQGVRDFFKKNKKQINNKFILDFAEAGLKGRKEEWLKVCEIMAKDKKDEKILADVLYITGSYFLLIDKKKGDDYLEKAIQIYQKINDPFFQGHAYLKKGIIYEKNGESSNAIEMYDKALPFFEKTRYTHQMGNVYLRKGGIYFGYGLKTGDFSKAFEMFEKALMYYEKTKGLFGLIGHGNAYKGKGLIFANAGEYSKAFEMHDKALSLYEKTKFVLGQGNIYLDKVEIYLRISDYTNALEFNDKALTCYEKVKDTLGQGNVFLTKGHIYLYTGSISKSLEMYEKALIFYEKCKDPIGQGHVYYGKGDIYRFTGEYAMALIMYDKALTFFKKVDDLLDQSNIYVNKGGVYTNIGYNQKALELYDKALIFFKKAGTPIGQGNAFLSKGLIYSSSGNSSKALEMLNNALTFFKNVDEPKGQGYVHLGMAMVFSKTNEMEKALKLYNKALKFFEKAEEPFGQGEVYRNKGDIYLLKGDHETALELYDNALYFYKKVGDIESKSNAFHHKATVLVKLGKKDKALDLFEKGIANLEKVRAQTAFSEMQRTFMEKTYDQYSETVFFMLDNKYYEKGFKYSESMRARVFLDQMAEGLVPLDKGMKPQLKEERDNLVGKLSALSRQMQETPAKEEKKLQELKEEYHRVESQFDDLLIKIRLDNPLYASVNYPQPVSVRDLQTDVLKKGETLLSFFIAPGKAYAFIVSRDNFKVKPLPVNEKEIDGYVRRFLPAIKENHSNEMNRLGSLLYEKLFKPLEKYLKKTREIIIVPSGSLETIPFESLIVSKKNPERPVYLLEKYRLKYVQGATLLSILRKYYTNTTNNGASTAKSFIGFGDPVYDYENFKQGKPEQGSIKILATESTEDTESIFSHEDTRSDTEKKVEVKAEVEKEAPSGEIKKNWNNGMLEYWNVGMMPLGQIFNCQLLILNSESWQFLNPINLVQTIVFHQSPLTISPLTTHQSPITTHQSPLTNSPADEIKEIHRDRYARAGGIMDRLPHSGEEIQSIAQLFEKESLKSVIYLRDQATEDNARAANMKDFDYIHFSCHGLLNDDFQSLVLSQLPPDKSKEDGYFTLNEIMNCDYSAQLVVLSACDTGSGKMYKGEGVTGLTRAVMYAGTPAVVASLWKVDDIATKELMVRFYTNLLEKKLDKVEALRQAKLELLKNQNYRSPLYWSAFVMYGE